MNTTNALPRAGLFAVALLASAFPASAQTYLATEHVDIGIGYADGEWDLHAHDEDNDIEYEAGDVAFYVNPAFAATSRPASASFNFIGVNAGETYYRLPQSQNVNLPYLGVAAEEIEPGTFDTYLPLDARVTSSAEWVTLNLVSVAGPGAFSLWTSEDDGPLVWISSFDGIDATDRFYQLVGGHSHANFGFSAPGTYVVEFSATALLDGDFITSAPVAYTFTTAIPEPSSATALAGAFALGLVALRRRRRA